MEASMSSSSLASLDVKDLCAGQVCIDEGAVPPGDTMMMDVRREGVCVGAGREHYESGDGHGRWRSDGDGERGERDR